MSCLCRRTKFPFSTLQSPRLTRKTPRPLSQSSRRHASTTSTTTATDSLLVARVKTLLFGSAVAGSLYVTYLYATDTRASYHRWLVPRLLRLAYPDAEDAHHAGTAALKTLYALGLHPRERGATPSEASTSPLSTSVFGTPLANPVGISAGLDKHAEIPDALFALGAGVVEVGGCTPLPQAGNPRPRVFRVPAIDGMVNRYGLNSLGADDMALRLRTRLRHFARAHGLSAEAVLDGAAGVPPGSLASGRLLLVQMAKNKETDETDVRAVARDYVYCVRRLAPYADVLVVNVSSPNTPGLRDLQAAGPLTSLLSAVVDEAARCGRAVQPRVMVKVSPDEDEDAQVEGIVRAVYQSGVDGVIVGNTTKRRAGVVPEGARLAAAEQRALMETGGYSGPAMFGRTLDLVKRYRKMLDAQALNGPGGDSGGGGDGDNETVGQTLAAALPSVSSMVSGGADEAGEAGRKVIFATGGITDGRQALEILNAGASVAMVYTGLVYGGAGTITRIKSEMKEAI